MIAWRRIARISAPPPRWRGLVLAPFIVPSAECDISAELVYLARR